jgi:hypothetical protein
MNPTRHTAAAALVTTGVIHVVLFFNGYATVDITGPAFLVQGVAALVLAGLLYVSDRDVLAPIGAVALMTASVVALAAAYLGVFINTAERVIRAETGLSFGAGVVAAVACTLLVKQRAEMRQGTALPTPGVDVRTEVPDDDVVTDELDEVPLAS